MKKYILILLFFILYGCATTQNGLITIDGKLDDTEKVLVGSAADTAFILDPSVVRPVYLLTTAVLETREIIIAVSNPASYLDTLVDIKAKEKGLTPADAAALKRLVVLIKVRLKPEFDLPNMTPQKIGELLIQIVEEINAVAKVRL